MASRDHERTPGKLQVEFRSPSALLVAYSVNLSRGGMFIECEDELPPQGAILDLSIHFPDHSTIGIQGVVTWQRPKLDVSGPRGVGVQFDSLPDELGAVIDQLVLDYSRISVLVQCRDLQDRKTLRRMIKSIISTADVSFADDNSSARALIGPGTDLVVVDADEDEEAAVATLRWAQTQEQIPTIALGRGPHSPELVKVADEVLRNPPGSGNLRRAMLHLLSRPSRVTTTS